MLEFLVRMFFGDEMAVWADDYEVDEDDDLVFWAGDEEVARVRSSAWAAVAVVSADPDEEEEAVGEE